MTFILIFITAVVSVSCLRNREWFDRLALVPYRMVRRHEWYRAVTYGFVHGDNVHLLVNMFVLLSFGQHIERMFTAYQHAGTIASSYLTYGLLYFGGLVVAAAPDIVRKRDVPQYA